jgi:hypothetical protein
VLASGVVLAGRALLATVTLATLTASAVYSVSNMNILTLLFLGIATGAISMVVSRSTLLNSLHDWVEKRSVFLENLLSCPWCLSHWVSLIFTLIYHPLIVTSWFLPLDYFVTIMVMTVVSAVTARIIYSAYKPIFEQEK